MSKSQHYRAAGRHWKQDNILITSPFPGARTVEDVGRIILRNRGKADRYHLSLLNSRARTFFIKLRRSCIGGEFKRLMKARLNPRQFYELLKRVRESGK